MMSIEEIKSKVNSEMRRKKSLAGKLVEVKADMRATNKALHFWQRELQKAERLAKYAPPCAIAK